MKRRDEERFMRDARRMGYAARAQWAKENPGCNCCLTTFAVGFLGVFFLLVALGMMGFFDHLG